jgi:hypothetical protein
MHQCAPSRGDAWAEDSSISSDAGPYFRLNFWGEPRLTYSIWGVQLHRHVARLVDHSPCICTTYWQRCAGRPKTCMLALGLFIISASYA